MMQPDLNDLRLFVQVARAGGYAAASRETGTPRATLSRRIAGFEAQLGHRLIERSSRSFRLTASGEQLLARTEGLLGEAEAAIDALDTPGAAPRGAVRFAVAPSVLQLHLGEMVLEYLAEFPGVDLRIEATNRRVDLLREGFDFAIRAGDPASAAPDQVVLPLARVGHVLALAPELLPKARETLAETLTQIPPLSWAGATGPAHWRLQDRSGRRVTQPIAPRFAVADMALLQAAARAGLGIALLPRVMAAQDLAAGRLVALDLDLQAPEGRIHAVHTGSRGMRPVVRHLLDWLAQAYAARCTV